MSSEDNVRTDEYWMGVRDALRMVDSFNKWSKRNPGRAKSLEDFIHDGLIAAAKRCESCLRDKLGISFTEDDQEKDEIVPETPIELDVEDHEDEEVVLETPIEFEDESDDDEEDRIILDKSLELEDEPEEPESSFEEPISHVEPDLAPPPDISDELSISLDSVERIEDEHMEDLSFEGHQREFSTDFELVEPTPLVVDEDSVAEPHAEPEPEEFVSEPEYEEEVSSIPEPEELPERPSFTWAEYEDAVTPSSEPEPLDNEVDFLRSEDEPLTIDESEEVSEEPPEPPKIWSPYDEPSIIDEEDIDEEDEPVISKPEPMDEEEDEPAISQPPAPPPPPESEEDEEERKRRARRLFFGA